MKTQIYELTIPKENELIDEWVEAISLAEAKRYASARYPTIMLNIVFFNQNTVLKIEPTDHNPSDLPDGSFTPRMVVKQWLNNPVKGTRDG